MSRTPKLNRKSFPLPGWLLVTVMVVFCELILHSWISDTLNLGRMAVIAGFALGCGGLLGLILSHLPTKTHKAVSITVSLLIMVLYMAEFMLAETYQAFMTPQTMAAGAGGIAQDYLLLTLKMIGRNLGRILLLLSPVIGYGIFCRPEPVLWRTRALLAYGIVFCYSLSLIGALTVTRDANLLYSAYNFDNVVRSHGLNMGLTMEALNGVLPQEAPEFSPEAPAVVPVETPSEEDSQEVVEYGYNVLPIDFGAAAEAGGQGAVRSIHNYVNSLTPSKQNAFTGMFKGKNLILITAEAFTAEVIDPELTPTLYRMATQGIQFKEYYQPAWGASTTTGEFSNLIGLVPLMGGSSMNETYQQDLFLTMGNQLQSLGYHSTAYHNHLHDFYHRNNTHTHLGYDKFLARYGGLEGLSDCWPESDLEMIDITVPQYIDQQPFSIYYMTVSGHCEYSYTGNDMTEKNWDLVQHLNHSDIVKGYYAANLELEFAMESLLRQLEEAGIADDTLVVIATDHYPYGLERSKTWNNTKDHLAELYGVEDYDQFMRDHNALIMWSGAFEGMDIVVDTPVYSLDILPTVSNLFGVEYDSRLLVGRDVFSDAEPLVLWPDYNWITDKGTYCDGVFTPRDGVQVDETYVSRIKTVVKNKIKFSKSVVDTDYYDYVLNYMNSTAE